MILFGRDLSKIPCMKESFVFGIGSGVLAGLGAFLSTSRPAFAVNIALFTHLSVSTGWFVRCRTNVYVEDLQKLEELDQLPTPDQRSREKLVDV